MAENPMREIRVEKVTINIGVGEPGEKLERGKKLLERLTGRKVTTTHTRSRTTFGTPKGRPIGLKITMRGKAAIEFLKRALEATDGKVPETAFDRQGNMNFGIKEHIDIPGIRYDPELGIFGMDVAVTLERRGYRVKRKKIWRPIAITHRITAEQARDWAVKTFGVKVGE